MHICLFALSRRERSHARAIVAYLFQLDDLADAENTEVGLRRASLLEARARLGQVMAGHGPEPTLELVVGAIRALHIPADAIERYFDALLAELAQPTFETFSDWYSRVEPLAAVLASVGSDHVTVGRSQLWDRLREFFIAVMAVDVLVDVAPDLDRGRILIPQEDLSGFGAHPDTRQVTPAWRELMRFEIARARALVTAGAAGLALLPARSRRIFRAGAALYTEQLATIERNGYDVFCQPVRVPRRRQLAVAVRGLLFG